MQKLKHQIQEPWKTHFQNVQQEVQRQDQEILMLEGTIAIKRREQNELRRHAGLLVTALVEEAKLPPPVEGAYQLSPDGEYLTASVGDSEKE